MRTAVVHDWLNGMRGGEKVLEAILPLLPEPTVFTLFHVPGSVSAGIERYPIRASWLNGLPFSTRHYRRLSSLLSASGRRVRPDRIRLRRLLLPLRRQGRDRSDRSAPPLLLPHSGALRLRAVRCLLSTGSDPLLRIQASSDRPASRVGHRDRGTAGSIPGQFRGGRRADPPPLREGSGRLSASRGHRVLPSLAGASRRVPVDGRSARSVQRHRGRRRGGPGRSVALSLSWGGGPRRGASVRWPPDPSPFSPRSRPARLRDLYRSCAFFVQPGEEDFGISSVEALACGAPVVALARGGVLDVVREEAEGLLYEQEGSGGPRRGSRARGEDAVRLHCGEALRRAVLEGALPAGLSQGVRRDAAMIRTPTRRIAVLFLVSDLATTLFALLAAYALRFRAEIVPVTQGVPDAGSYYRLFPVIAVLWPAVYYFYGLYQVRRNRSRVEEGLAVLVATGLATLMLTGLGRLLSGLLLLAARASPLLRPRRSLRVRGPYGDPPLPRRGVAARVRRPPGPRRRRGTARAGGGGQAHRASGGGDAGSRHRGRRPRPARPGALRGSDPGRRPRKWPESSKSGPSTPSSSRSPSMRIGPCSPS